MINVKNLFDYCDNSIECKDVLYLIGKSFGNTVLQVAIKNSNNYIYKYSNEWLYLINVYYPHNPYYNEFINFYNTIINKKNVQVINQNVISFITSFSLGTVHGYSGLFYIIDEYLKNKDKFINHKIIVYKNSQNGLLNIIEHFINRGFINKNNIIYLEQNIIYHFTSIYFISNKYHIFNIELGNKVSNLINKYITPDTNNLVYMKSLKLPTNLEKILIIKGSNSINLTSDGVFLNNHINNFKNKWNLTHIEPGLIHEIHLIHIIQECSIFVVSWGTSFFKNYVYISDKCKKIIVLILKNSNFHNQYNNGYGSISKFKNANIIYKIVNNDLNFNLYH